MIPVFDQRAHDVLEHHEVEHVAVGRKRALGLDPHAIVMAMQRLAFTSEGDEVRGAELQIAALDQDPPGHVRPPATPHALGRRAATYRHAPPAFLMRCALPLPVRERRARRRSLWEGTAARGGDRSLANDATSEAL